MNIHFICRGNVLRSLIAETYLKSLELPDIHATSSGTNVDRANETEQEYFANTLKVLDRHGIKSFAKPYSDQLTQARADGNDVTVCMNQRVVGEARLLVDLPASTISWDIVDIGEGNRIVRESRELYEEEIYKEITNRVDELISANEENN